MRTSHSSHLSATKAISEPLIWLNELYQPRLTQLAHFIMSDKLGNWVDRTYDYSQSFVRPSRQRNTYTRIRV